MAFSVIDCAEELGTRQENPTLEGFTASVTLRCDYANRYLLAEDLLLNSRLWPFTHATVSPIASGVTIRNESEPDGAGQKMLFTQSLLDVTYSHDIKNLITEELEPALEFQKLDHRLFKWKLSGDPVLEPEAPGRQLRYLNFIRTYYLVNSIPAAILSNMGGVNDAPVTATTLGITFATESLLYEPPNLSTTISTAGTDYFTLRVKFGAHPENWNTFWRAKTQTWERMALQSTGGDYDNYPKMDFTNLLNVPQG